jgi:SAM-dependent methyltransferase
MRAARMTVDEAVRHFRTTPAYAGVVRDTYLGTDVEDSARRFLASGEFDEVKQLLGRRVTGATVADLGAGIGIASWAFLESGAKRVLAIEPDTSEEVGQGAMRRLPGSHRLEVLSAFGESIPLSDQSVDIVYARQVLHHTRDLPLVMRECARILRPGGTFLATREHVVNNEWQRRRFLRKHVMHRLAGGENAYRLREYIGAIQQSQLSLRRILGPWDSVINAFPHARSNSDLERLPAKLLRDRFGALGHIVGDLPIVRHLLWAMIRMERPGRMYSFLAVKPSEATSRP